MRPKTWIKTSSNFQQSLGLLWKMQLDQLGKFSKIDLRLAQKNALQLWITINCIPIHWILEIVVPDITPNTLKASELRTLRLAHEISKHGGQVYNVNQICNLLRVVCNSLFQLLWEHFLEINQHLLELFWKAD